MTICFIRFHVHIVFLSAFYNMFTMAWLGSKDAENVCMHWRFVFDSAEFDTTIRWKFC
jgi:hypothetical protein